MPAGADLTGLAPLDRRRWVLAHALDPALSELPPLPSQAAARQILMTIAGVESGCLHRRQVPVAYAMGFWQFEKNGGVAGVLTHRATQALARKAVEQRGLDHSAGAVWKALEQDDVLAGIFARLLLLSDPPALPSGPDAAKACYLRTWRPGKPCSASAWERSWEMARTAIAG